MYVNDVGRFRTGICSQKTFALSDTRSPADVNETGVASPGALEGVRFPFFFFPPFFFFLNLQRYYEHLENKFFPND